MSESVKVCSWCKGKGALYKSVAGRMDVCPSCHGKGNYGYIQTTKPTQPSHYHTGNIDVIKFSEENFGKDELKGFYRMNVLKYTTRYDKKNGLEDLEKATFYLDKLKELERGKHERD